MNKVNTRMNKAATHIVSTTQTTTVESKPPDGTMTNELATKPKVYIKPCLMCKGIHYLGQCHQFRCLNFDPCIKLVNTFVYTATFVY